MPRPQLLRQLQRQPQRQMLLLLVAAVVWLDPLTLTLTLDSEPAKRLHYQSGQ